MYLFVRNKDGKFRGLDNELQHFFFSGVMTASQFNMQRGTEPVKYLFLFFLHAVHLLRKQFVREEYLVRFLWIF